MRVLASDLKFFFYPIKGEIMLLIMIWVMLLIFLNLTVPKVCQTLLVCSQKQQAQDTEEILLAELIPRGHGTELQGDQPWDLRNATRGG